MANAKSVAGELELIEQIRRTFAHRRRSTGVILGIGDDCAVLRPIPGSDLVLTTDFSLEGSHFRRDLHPPESAGHRCLARGLSDLAAMGATPMAAFLSLALPAALVKTRSGRSWVKRFLDGINGLAQRFAVPLAGGDTAEAPADGVLADIVLVGSVPQGRALRRSAARAGDLIYVTGALGGAAAELQAMMSNNAAPTKSKMVGVHPQMFPEPRIRVGQALLGRQLATACIDLSDGLSSDLAHLCRESGVGAELEASSLPIHSFATGLAADRLTARSLALNGGEDYELLFAARPETRMPRKLCGVTISLIGRFTSRRTGMVLIDPDGSRSKLEPGGWENFGRRHSRSITSGRRTS